MKILDTSGIDLANINPFRYRGYYCDVDTSNSLIIGTAMSMMIGCALGGIISTRYGGYDGSPLDDLVPLF